jgi:class 3 adenylate cyclase
MDEKISGGSLASTQKKLRKFYLKRHGVHSGDKKIGSFETERLITAISKITDLLRKCWGVAGAGIISANLARNPTGDTVVFNPTVPGKLVYAIFAFVGISDFAHLLSCLKEEIMDVINDVARVVHSEVFRWGFGNSGQCNKNLGPCFLISYRIGEVKEVQRKKAKAAEVIFKDSNRKTQSNMKSRKSRAFVDVSDDVTNLQLSSLPGIQEFTDRALLGMIKSFAGINRDEHVMKWSNHFSLGSGVGAFSVELLFGMHAGWAVEGAVGSGYKIDATYLSPHVNTASRMMGACKQYRVSLLMSQAVEELLSDEARKEVRHIDTITVKGSVVPQRIYTFDARHKGVSFFLNQRTDEVADEDAEHYTPNIWLSDRDITDMKSHITPEFESTFKAGLKLYFEGKWKDAIAKLSYADKILFDNVLEADLMSEFDRRMDDMKELRHQLGDGPSQVLIKYMQSHNGIAPKDWNGVHKLTAK